MNKKLLHNTYAILACLWLASAALAPNLWRIGPWAGRLEDIILIVMLAVALHNIVTHRWRVQQSGLLLALASFSAILWILGLTAILVEGLIGEGLPGKGTFGHAPFSEVAKEWARAVKYIAVAIAFTCVPVKGWKPLLLTLIFSCVTLVSVQMLQYLRVNDLNDWIAAVYTPTQPGGDGHLSLAYVQYTYWRSGSLMLNPNILGAFLTAPFLLSFMHFVRAASSIDSWKKPSLWRWGVATGVIALGVVLTQSRASFLSITVASIIITLLALPLTHLKLRRLIIPVVIVLMSSVLVIVVSGQKLSRIWLMPQWSLVPGVEDTLEKKIGFAASGLEDMHGWQLLVGKGPALAPSTDSELGFMVTWYGALGFLAFLAFYCWLSLLILRRVKDPYLRLAFLGTLMAYLVGSVSNSYFLCSRVFPVFIALLTVACSRHDKATTLGYQVSPVVGSAGNSIESVDAGSGTQNHHNRHTRSTIEKWIPHRK